MNNPTDPQNITESVMKLINRLNKMKIKGSLKVIDIELKSLVAKGKMDKLHEAIKDSDVSSFKTTIQMIVYCVTLRTHLYKIDQNDREGKLRFAEGVLNDFKIYKINNIPEDEEDDKPLLDTFYATFHLMATQLKLSLKKITIEEVDLKLMKDQLILIFNSESREHFLFYLRFVTEDLMFEFSQLRYLKAAKVFLNICTYILEKDAQINDEVAKQQFLSNQHVEIMCAEDKYFRKFLFDSCELNRENNSWIQELKAKQEIFGDLLEKLGIEDKYKDIPEMIQTFDQAEKFFKMYLPKIDEYEKLIDTDQSDRPNRYLLYNPMMIRGRLYHAMAVYQKDAIKKAELSKQSLKFFINLLQKDFTEHKTQQYAQNDDQHMLYFYDVINTKISENYKNVIIVKVDYIMNLPSHSEETQSQIKELNILRRDFAVQLMVFEKFANENPGLYGNDRMVKLYHEIAVQFRSIILTNQKNQQNNLDRSNAFLLLQSKFARLCLTKDEFWASISAEDFVHVWGHEIDEDPFIIKFRVDLQ